MQNVYRMIMQPDDDDASYRFFEDPSDIVSKSVAHPCVVADLNPDEGMEPECNWWQRWRVGPLYDVLQKNTNQTAEVASIFYCYANYFHGAHDEEEVVCATELYDYFFLCNTYWNGLPVSVPSVARPLMSIKRFPSSNILSYLFLFFCFVFNAWGRKSDNSENTFRNLELNMIELFNLVK